MHRHLLLDFLKYLKNLLDNYKNVYKYHRFKNPYCLMYNENNVD